MTLQQPRIYNNNDDYDGDCDNCNDDCDCDDCDDDI